jgi:hypothetical protein
MAPVLRYGIALVSSVVALSFMLFYQSSSTDLVISDHMSEFIDAVDRHPAHPENKLIAIDLDDTTFSSTKLLGTPSWFYHMVNFLRQSGAAKSEAYEIMNKIDNFVQARIQVALIEKATVRAVISWQKQHAIVFGFSSRLPSMAEITKRQVKAVGLDFSSPHFACAEKSWPKNQGSFQNGILFVDDYANKAKILDKLLELLLSCGMEIKLLAHADDQQHYVNKVSKLAKKRRIDFIGIIYGGAFKTRNFDLHEANKQLLELEASSNAHIIPDEYRQIFIDN